MPDVFILCEYPTLNGGEFSMLSTLDGVRAGGFTPAVIAPSVGPLGELLRSRGVEVLPFGLCDAVGKRLPLTEIRTQLAELLRRRRPDLLHANSLSTGRISGPVAAELGLPSMAHLRDIVRLSAQAVADLNCHRRLVAVSEATRQFHAAGGLDAKRLHVLHNGVDIERFRPRSPSGYLHRELGLVANAKLIATIGQISLRKGQDVLVRAAASLGPAADALHFLIVGERYSQKGESRRFEENLRNPEAWLREDDGWLGASAASSQNAETWGLAALDPSHPKTGHPKTGHPKTGHPKTGHPNTSHPKSDLSGRLHFLGFRDDVDRLLGELTLLVHAARQEPLGRVLLEAAASGVAIVATDVGGTPESFPSTLQSARLIPPDDPEALAAAIAELAADQPQRERLAAAARHRAEQAFNVGRATEALLHHYRAITSHT